jgi:Fe-S-cluster containining protein
MQDLATGTASTLHGTVRGGWDRVEYITSFTGGLRFRCLPECGLCCKTYRIPLTGIDLDRLREVVRPESCPGISFANLERTGAQGDTGEPEGGPAGSGEPEGIAENSNVAAFMENGKAGGCCYLDEEARCTVYRNRPLYCRTYPLIRDTYEHLEMSVDYSCPGVGEGDPLTTEQIEEAFALEARDRPGVLKVRESFANYNVICGSLKAMGVYTEAELMRSVCAELIGRALKSRREVGVSAYLTWADAALKEIAAGSGNIPDSGAAAQVVTGITEGVDKMIAPGAAGKQESKLTGSAAKNLADYLAEWVRRQALLRFVHSTALARPVRLNVLHPFFNFLVEAARIVLKDADELRSLEGEQRITARLIRKAIRRNEGPLRSRCASVVSTY